MKKNSKTAVTAFAFLGLFIFNSTKDAGGGISQSDDSANLIFMQAFDKGQFVDILTSADLEVYVNGQIAQIDGLALVKGLEVRRSEGKSIASPVLPRVFIIEFRGSQYDPKFGQMIEHLFRSPYSPEDTISLVTPVKPYGFSSQTLREYPREELIHAGLTVLKRDISSSGQIQVDLNQEMTRLVLDLPGASTPRDALRILREYQQKLENLKMLRKFDDSTLIRAIDYFSRVRAQKHYIVVCQQEFLPIPNSEVMERLLSNQNIMFQASELFRKVESGEGEDLEPLIKELTDSGIVVNFLYFKMNPRVRPEIQIRELSTDMFDMYSELARSTGGIVEATMTPAAQLKKILANSENYYLISCPPEERDQNLFLAPEREVRVRLKSGDFSLIFFRL